MLNDFHNYHQNMFKMFKIRNRSRLYQCLYGSWEKIQFSFKICVCKIELKIQETNRCKLFDIELIKG